MTAPQEITPEERRGDHLYRARMWRWILALDLGFWLIVLSIAFPPPPLLVWNASASAPVGLYRVSPGAQLARGDMAIARTPSAFRRLAAERRYLPENVPLVKRVAGIAGDRICAIGEAITVNGRRVATRLASDGRGRSMPWWRGCRVLGAGEYFLLMDAPASFDGRYFGISEQADIIGRAYPLWTR
jgi:conjugative transfer signal peptidase TraF